jgi:hypothetical protein
MTTLVDDRSSASRSFITIHFIERFDQAVQQFERFGQALALVAAQQAR